MIRGIFMGAIDQNTLSMSLRIDLMLTPGTDHPILGTTLYCHR